MQESDHHILNVALSTTLPPQSVHHTGNKPSKVVTAQNPPSIVPEKRGKVKTSRHNEVGIANGYPENATTHEQRINIQEEQSVLLGYEVLSGKLSFDKRYKGRSSDDQSGLGIGNAESIDAKLTSKALTWGSQKLYLADVISVSYNAGLRNFTLHAFPIRKRTCGLHHISKPERSRKDFHFLASSSEEAFQWIGKFAELQCYINRLPHPTTPNKKQASDITETEPLYDPPDVKSKAPPKVLVVLNPRSGHGRSSKVFHEKVEPIFQLAGFKMEIVKTTSAGHARKLASTVDFALCPDGIICVGGDGIVNEVLNGLLSRGDQKEAVSKPIGIIPAGSDNSLVWTVLGARDPISAAITIIKGGLTALDIFAVEWIQTGRIHYGTTVSYFGFLSNVLELSEKYQKRFGPLRYFVAGFLKFLCLPKYEYELEYLPLTKDVSEPDGNLPDDKDRIDISDLYTDIMCGSSKEEIPRASSLSSIDSVMSPTRMSGSDLGMVGSTHANIEPSDYVRGLDSKSKRLSIGRNNFVTEPEEVLHPQLRLSTTPNIPRTRSKSRTDKTWNVLSSPNDSRFPWAATATNDKEDISSTMSDPGPIWDSEPKWDTEAKWEGENSIQLPGPPEDREPVVNEELVPRLEHKWVVKKGQFLAVLVCNHSCKTVQSLSSQVVAPKAMHDDNSLDLLLVHGSGRMKLLRFFVRLQFGRHLSLPFVEYVKVKSVKLRPGKNCHNGCGIDGELFSVNRQIICYLHPQQCKLIGRRSARD